MRFTTLAALALSAFGLCQPCLAAADPACSAEIKALMLASISSGPFHLDGKVTGGTTGDILSTMEMIPPGAIHSVSNIAGMVTEMTFVDGRGFMKMGGTWTELPKEMSGTMTELFSAETVETSFGNLAKAECAAPTHWEGTSALRYTLTTSVSGVTSDITLWIDATTRLPIHSETVTTPNGQPITSISDYRYDPKIEIKAPL